MKISSKLKILVGIIGSIAILATVWVSGTGCCGELLTAGDPNAPMEQRISALVIFVLDAYAERLKEESPLPHKTPLPVNHENIKYEERSPAQGGSFVGKKGC